MANIKKKEMETLLGIVQRTLEDYPETRKNDALLVLRVLKTKGIDTCRSFVDLMSHGELKQVESITRLRRQVQSKFPELRDPKVAELRAEAEADCKEYFAKG